MITKRLYILITILFVVTVNASPIPPAPEVNVKSYVLLDFDSGMILASSNEDLTLPPASITKIMTAYIAFTELKEKNAKWFVHIFGGVSHAFTNPDADDEPNGLKYNRDAMHMSWKIMKNYFNRFLHKKL